jgi:Domain of unknown function DUF29
MTDPALLHDKDFVLWTETQAAALRAAAQGKSNQPLDWGNLAEEIESLGRSDRRELRSQIYRIVRHLVKLQFSPAVEPRRGWREAIRDGRKQAQLILVDSPGLMPRLEEFVSEESGDAIERAITDLEEYGDLAPATEPALRAAHYTVDQVIGDWFPLDPDGTAKN